MPSSRADASRLAQAISTGESSYSQSHVQNESLLYPASATLELPACEHTGPTLRQSTHRTGAPMKTVAEVKAQLELELFDGKNQLQEAPTSAASIYRSVQGLNNERIKRYLKKTSLYDTDANWWTTIPEKGPENGLYLPFTNIMNDILIFFGLSHATAADTHKAKLTCLEEHRMKYVDENDNEVLTKTSPDICIMGTGNKFRRKEPGPGPTSYFHCVAPVELKTEKLLSSVGLRAVVLQIAVYVRQCFNHQPNRRFACAIMATEENFRLMVFDRLGGMQTGSFNIHASAMAFVRVIVGIASYTDTMLTCFDTAVSWLPCTSCITQYLHLKITSCFEVAKDDRGKRDLEIVLNSKPFARRAIRGRGTRCWLGVILSGRDRTPVVVKESWRSKGRDAEWVLLKRVVHFDGVGKMLYYCDTEEDTISRFRSLIFGDIASDEDSFDRIFSRVVLEAYGPPIHYFNTPLQLLQVLRDAVSGHSFMWEAGILHRDISIHNIVHGKENATSGNLGVLIDLDMAIDVKNYEKNTESRTGTRAFQSIMVVSPFIPGTLRPPQDHLDDLESFFYVLLWICMLFVAPNKMAIRDGHSRVHQMEDPRNRACADNKLALLSSPTNDMNPWFVKNAIFYDLVDGLASFLKVEVEKKMKIIAKHNLRPDVEFPDVKKVHTQAGTKHHQSFITYLDVAIEELQSDQSKGPDPTLYLGEQQGDVVDLDASATALPSVLETGTTYGNALKRERSDSDGDAGIMKRAHLDKDATSAAAGISHLQISDPNADEGTN